MSSQNGSSGGGAAVLPPPHSGPASGGVGGAAVAAQGEEFQRYLEKSGVIDALTKVLVGLYESPEKPSNAIDYVKEYLGVSLSQSDPAQSAALQEKDAEIAQLKAQVAQLQAQLQGKGADKGSEAGEKPSNATAAAAE